MNQSLSPTALAVWRAIADHIAAHGIAPTRRELADAVGVASTNTVSYTLDRLRAAGIIAPAAKPYAARAIHLLKLPPEPRYHVVERTERGTRSRADALTAHPLVYADAQRRLNALAGEYVTMGYLVYPVCDHVVGKQGGVYRQRLDTLAVWTVDQEFVCELGIQECGIQECGLQAVQS